LRRAQKPIGSGCISCSSRLPISSRRSTIRITRSAASFITRTPSPRPSATHNFLKHRAPKYLGYFETVIEKSKGPYALGANVSYIDLSLFQLIEGLRYAFPNAMKRIERGVPRVVAAHDKVAERERIKKYLKSPRRIPFNESGIFRHYPELDD